MRKYELAMLLKPLLPEDVHNRIVPELTKIVTKLKGKLSVKEDWGKRHLAYDVQGLEEGYYIFFEMELDPAKTAQLEKAFVPMSDILRYLIIREDQL